MLKMKTLILDGVEYTLTPKEEFTYPMFFKHNHSELVVRFDGLEIGKTIIANEYNKVGPNKSYWVPHTDTDNWTQVEDPKTILDKHLVYCWDYGLSPQLRFYDAVNKCVFYNEGSRSASSWGHYLKADIQSLPEPLKSKMIEMQNKLED